MPVTLEMIVGMSSGPNPGQRPSLTDAESPLVSAVTAGLLWARKRAMPSSTGRGQGKEPFP